MDLAENRSNHPNNITSANAQQCIIANHSFAQTIVIPSQDEVFEMPLQSVNDLTDQHILQLCEFQPEVLIIATGAQIQFPEPEILAPLIKQNIGLEVLDNQAAARTFNVLLAEDRKAVCLMIIA